jgi:hypothetical protein
MKLKLPRVLSIDETLKGNTIQQLALPSCTIEATVADYTAPFLKAKLLIPTNDQDDRILLLSKRWPAPDRFARIIAGTPRQLGMPVSLLDVSDGTWLRHPRLPGTSGAGIEHRKEVERVLSSWEGSFSYMPENVQQGDQRPSATAARCPPRSARALVCNRCDRDYRDAHRYAQDRDDVVGARFNSLPEGPRGRDN